MLSKFAVRGVLEQAGDDFITTIGGIALRRGPGYVVSRAHFPVGKSAYTEVRCMPSSMLVSPKPVSLKRR